tara:strand:+ start:16 stop:567 length:552 start_codon:yes stop_codon:yes gene_type:complete
MVAALDKMVDLIKNDNTNKIKYVILFFIFIVGLSQNLFNNIFGCNLKKIIKNNFAKHAVSLLFLFLLIDINSEGTENKSNPLISLFYSGIIYLLVFLLLHSNKIYIIFISIIIFVLIVLDKFKSYYENTINDQEEVQGKLDLIYKTTNVFVIIIILTIIIGTVTSLDMAGLKNTLRGNIKSCA